MFKLYFLSGVITKEEIEQYRDTIEQLRNGELSGLSFEKLRGYSNIYSVRDSHKARLLISFPLINGRRSLLIMEALPNHEYAKSRVLRSAIIRQYIADVKQIGHTLVFESLEKNADEVKKLSPQASLSASPSSSSSSSNSDNEIVKPVHYYFSSYIEHSSEQIKAIGADKHGKEAFEIQKAVIEGPRIITGPSGSGKSCVAVAKARVLYNWLSSEHCSGNTRTITYIAPTKALCAQVEASFKATLPEEANPNVVVKFLTYQEWLDLPVETSLVGFELFETTLNNIRGISQLNSCHEIKNFVQAKNKNRSANARKLYTELQMLAVLKKEDNYLKLGARESLYEDQKIREQIQTLFEYYRDFLNRKNMCDLALNPQSFFHRESAKGKHFVLVDEAQSIPPSVLNLLLEHYGESSYFFADSNQNTEMQLSVLPLLKKWLNVKSDNHVESIRLEMAYRCQQAITKAANFVLKMKRFVAQGTSDKSETTKMSFAPGDFEGRVDVIKNEPTAIETLNQRFTKEQLRCAVVSPKELMDKAKQLFPGILVFTAQEIRGLQFDHIIAYGLFSTNEMRALNDKLRELEKGGYVFDPRAEDYVNLPKKGSESEARFNPELNGLFIAFTRAMKSLSIVDNYNDHHCQFTTRDLYGYLNPPSQSSHQAESSASSSATATTEPPEVAEVSSLEYLELVNQLLLNGNEAQAKDLFLRNHRGEAEDFERLKQHLNPSAETTSSHAVQEETSSSTSNFSNTVSKSSRSEERPSGKRRRTKKPSSSVVAGSVVPQGVTAPHRSELYQLSLTEAGCKKLLKRYQNKIKKLSIEELCDLDAVDQLPPLYWLAHFVAGKELLGKLLEEQIKKIKPKALCAIYSKFNVSVIFLLANHLYARELLNKFSDEQIAGINIDALCSLHHQHSIPALWLLAEYREGCAFLCRLTDMQIKAIRVELLFLNDSKFETSIFCMLAGYPEGRAFLRRLSDMQIKAIGVEQLCAYDSSSNNVPLLFMLASDSDGLAFLARLSDEQIKAISVHPQFVNCFMGNHSIYSVLSNTEEGSKLKNRLIDYNPSLLVLLGENYLKKTGQTASHETLLTLLQTTEINQEILSQVPTCVRTVSSMVGNQQHANQQSQSNDVYFRASDVSSNTDEVIEHSSSSRSVEKDQEDHSDRSTLATDQDSYTDILSELTTNIPKPVEETLVHESYKGESIDDVPYVRKFIQKKQESLHKINFELTNDSKVTAKDCYEVLNKCAKGPQTFLSFVATALSQFVKKPTFATIAETYRHWRMCKQAEELRAEFLLGYGTYVVNTKRPVSVESEILSLRNITHDYCSEELAFLRQRIINKLSRKDNSDQRNLILFADAARCKLELAVEAGLTKARLTK